MGSSSSPIFIADLFWVWWWSDFFFLAMGSSSSPICFGFGGGLIFFFLAVGSSSSPICSGFGGCLIFDFFFLAVGCGCHIEVVVV